MPKVKSNSPLLPIGLALGAGIVFAIGDVVDWTAPKVEYDYANNTYTKFQGDAVIGVGCDCLTPGAIGYAAENNACSGQTILETIATETAKEYTYDWDFHSGGGDAYCGQWANGDYWFSPNTGAGQTTVTLTSIASTGGFGAAQLTSADENVQIELMGLLTGVNSYGSGPFEAGFPNYSASENIISSLPKVYSSDLTVTSAILDNNECGTGATGGECAGAYMSVTVLDAPAFDSQNSIRAAIGSTDKTPFAYSSFDVASIPSRADLALTDGLDAIINRSNHCINILSFWANDSGGFSEGGRAFRCEALSDEYAAGYSETWLSDFMQLGTNSVTLADKKRAIAALITNGVDIYHALFTCSPTTCTRNGTRLSGSGAAQWGGNMMPSLLFASLLAPGNKYAAALMLEEGTENTFQELQQLWAGSNGVVWGDGSAVTDAGNYQEVVKTYWTELWKNDCFAGAPGVCQPNATATGPKNRRDPYGLIDGPEYDPGKSYMENTTSANKAIAVIAELIPSVNTTINWGTNLKDFAKRTHYDGVLSQVDTCAKPDPRDFNGVGSCDPFNENGCLYYGPNNTGVATWGPQPTDLFNACIEVNTEWTLSGTWSVAPITAGHPNFQTAPLGRFPAKNGDPISLTFVVSQSEAIFETVLPE